MLDIIETKSPSTLPISMPEPDGERKMLTFSLGGKMFALPANVVSEVLHPPMLTPLPAAPEAVLGITVIGGDVRPVVDLARLLEITQPVNYSRSKMIIIHDPEMDTAICVPVDKIRDITGLSIPYEGASVNTGFLKCSVKNGVENMSVIDHRKIFDAIRPS